MSKRVTSLRRSLAILFMALLLALSSSLHASAAYSAPAHARGHAPLHSGTLLGDTITATAPLPLTITSTSGLTVIRLPQQVASGGRLLIEGHTAPYAYVALIIGFPDGSKISTHTHAHKSGDFRLTPLITYQPQGSAEAATVTLHAVQRKVGLDDTLPGSVTILQHIVIPGYLKVPGSVAPGGQLAISIAGSLPNVYVRFYLNYPDKQEESHTGGYTDATGALSTTISVSASDGKHGDLTVTALLTYQGVERRISNTVALRGGHAAHK